MQALRRSMRAARHLRALQCLGSVAKHTEKGHQCAPYADSGTQSLLLGALKPSCTPPCLFTVFTVLASPGAALLACTDYGAQVQASEHPSALRSGVSHDRWTSCGPRPSWCARCLVRYPCGAHRRAERHFLLTFLVVQVLVEYSPESVDAFIEIADAVEEAFPQLKVEGSEVPGRVPALTVTCDDVTVSGEDATATAVVEALRKNFRGSLQDVHLE